LSADVADRRAIPERIAEAQPNDPTTTKYVAKSFEAMGTDAVDEDGRAGFRSGPLVEVIR
jgi:hypothetical protein